MDGAARFPFAFGWYGSDLPGYRACDGTYCFFPYADLPPLDPPSETLDWLGPLDEATDRKMQVYRDRATTPGPLEEIEAAAGRLGLSLPEPFLRLMASPALQARFPSPTACYFELARAIVPFPGSQDGFIVRFLNDQQNVLTWYLYLTREGASGVIVTPYWLEELTGVQGDDAPGSTLKVTMGEGPDAPTWEYKSGPQYAEKVDPQALQQVVASTYVCGPSFVSFLYRYWLESGLWFKLEDASCAQLSEVERRYLAHYRDRSSTPDRPDHSTPPPTEPGPEPPPAGDSPPPVAQTPVAPPAAGPGSHAPTDRRDGDPARKGGGGGAAMARVLGLIGLILGVAVAALGALPTGWLGGLNGVGGSGHLRADALVAAGVVLLLLGIVGLVRPSAAQKAMNR